MKVTYLNGNTINTSDHNYYRNSVQRQNGLLRYILDTADFFASFPKLLLEVFIRKNLGQRYFSTSGVIILIIVMLLLAMGADGTLISLTPLGQYSTSSNSSVVYITWYLFIIAFAYFGYQRWKETKKPENSTWNFKKLSKYSGDIDPRFYKLSFFGKPDIKLVETVLEPGFFFIIGILLALIGQRLGIILIISSIAYSLSNLFMYWRNDNSYLNVIDEFLVNKEGYDRYVKGNPGDPSIGVRFHRRRPENRDYQSWVARKQFDGPPDDLASDVS